MPSPISGNFSCLGETKQFTITPSAGCPNCNTVTVSDTRIIASISGNILTVTLSRNGNTSFVGDVRFCGGFLSVSQSACSDQPQTWYSTKSCNRTATRTGTCPSGSTVTGNGDETRQGSGQSSVSQADADAQAQATACANAQAAADAEAQADLQAKLATCPTVQPCTYQVQEDLFIEAAGGPMASSVVTNISNCGWSASSNNIPQLTLTNASGTGIGQVRGNVQPNTTASQRVFTITFNGLTATAVTRTIRVTQAAGSSSTCTYQVQESVLIEHGGGPGSVSVTATGTGCTEWIARSNNGEMIGLKATSQPGPDIAEKRGTGTGTIWFSVGGNPGTTQRIGTITFNVPSTGFTRTISVTQP
jgi:hypothetical protein